MTQSEWLAGALLAGFLIYLGMKGRLAAYWALLTGGTGAPAAPAYVTSQVLPGGQVFGSVGAAQVGQSFGSDVVLPLSSIMGWNLRKAYTVPPGTAPM